MQNKYKIWDKGVLVPAFINKPKDERAEKLNSRTIQEAKIGIKWFIPADKLKDVDNANT